METKWYHEVVWITETSPNPGYTSLSGSMPTGKPHYAFADVVTKMTGEDSGCNEEVLEFLRAAPETATQRDELLEALKEARIGLSNTRSNIQTDLMMHGNERWDGVPEKLKLRLDQIDSVIDRATGASS